MQNLESSSAPCVDPVPQSLYPTLQTFAGPQPILPPFWQCTALLHPFSPLQSNSTPADKASPFFEICTATVYYAEGIGLNALLIGSSGRRWWYQVTPSQTLVSTDGINYTPINLGWSVPGTNWFGDKSDSATCAGTSALNWMGAQQADWWKMPVGNTPNKPPATWMWFDHNSQLPVRLMFGQGPVVAPGMGDVNQLALFQMFSFTYFPSFEPLQSNPLNDPLVPPFIDGFNFGNPNNYDLFTWNSNFGMTVFMTPVNENFNPLPTRVLYEWKADADYKVTADRSQDTLMQYTYNPTSEFDTQVALLTGPAPASVKNPPANSDAGFIINYKNGEITNCSGYSQFPFPQEPPTWVQIPGEEGTIWATVVNNEVLCPNNTVTIVSVLFPASQTGNNYPDSTYLWTWYSPLNDSGSNSRPVTFMQSQSGVGLGTSLALADYFYYEEFAAPIPPCNFAVPPCDFTINANGVYPPPPYPSAPWMDTGITMNPNTSANILYTGGLWTANPADNNGQQYDAAGNPIPIVAKPGYTMPKQNEGALIGKVGDTVFLIGNGATTPVGLSGDLQLCINDDLNGEYGAGLTDNTGSVNVQITVTNV